MNGMGWLMALCYGLLFMCVGVAMDCYGFAIVLVWTCLHGLSAVYDREVGCAYD